MLTIMKKVMWITLVWTFGLCIGVLSCYQLHDFWEYRFETVCPYYVPMAVQMVLFLFGKIDLMLISLLPAAYITKLVLSE